jgi:hypothetical protein
MPADQSTKTCSYYVVRYAPHAEREEFLNIGILLHSPEEQFLDCLITRDLRRIKDFHRQADLEFLRGLQGYFEQQIQQHEDNLQAFLDEMEQSLSHLIQLAPARLAAAAESREQILRLFERLVGKRTSVVQSADTRMRIKQSFVEALRHARVFEDKRLEKRIPAAPLTHPGDPFHFDFGYRPAMSAEKGNGHLKLLHTLSLHRDPELASVLSLTIGYVRAKQPAELTAVVEGWPARTDKTAGHSYRILSDAGITMHPVSEVDSLARVIRDELGGNVFASV